MSRRIIFDPRDDRAFSEGLTARMIGQPMVPPTCYGPHSAEAGEWLAGWTAGENLARMPVSTNPGGQAWALAQGYASRCAGEPRMVPDFEWHDHAANLRLAWLKGYDRKDEREPRPRG